MPTTIIGLCTLEFHLPGVASLKEKRGILKSMLHRIRNTFNVSVAEVDHHDVWQSAAIAFTTVSTSTRHVQQTLTTVIDWIETHYAEAMIVKQDIEIL
jgi:hypothetical protein